MHRGTMDQLDNYKAYVTITKEMAYLSQRFFLKAKGKYSFKAAVGNDYYDIRDLLKKCPNCGIIWMRAEGCDGSTNCGRKPSKFWDFFTSKSKYIFKRTAGTVKMEIR